jgi:hypothetical protein
MVSRLCSDKTSITASGPEGKGEFRLGPGSYFMQPGGNYRHTTTCDKTSECVFFVEREGRFDLEVVTADKPPK